MGATEAAAAGPPLQHWEPRDAGLRAGDATLMHLGEPPARVRRGPWGGGGGPYEMVPKLRAKQWTHHQELDADALSVSSSAAATAAGAEGDGDDDAASTAPRSRRTFKVVRVPRGHPTAGKRVMYLKKKTAQGAT
mmetsp:Transcript_6565/g.18588  ORF Transcript_6565/g.18588 Transcript_6565/m.18588 type:complete len:135 (-) Transcript_6565:119-523(-)